MSITRVNPEWNPTYEVILDWGTYSTQGQTVTLNKSFRNYKAIIIRSGVNNGATGGGGGISLEIIPVYFYESIGVQWNATYYLNGKWSSGTLEVVDDTHLILRTAANGYKLRTIIGVN